MWYAWRLGSWRKGAWREGAWGRIGSKLLGRVCEPKAVFDRSLTIANFVENRRELFLDDAITLSTTSFDIFSTQFTEERALSSVDLFYFGSKSQSDATAAASSSQIFGASYDQSGTRAEAIDRKNASILSLAERGGQTGSCS